MAKLDPDVISFEEVCVDGSENMIGFIRSGLRSRGYAYKSYVKVYTHKAWDKYDEYMLMFSKHNAQKTQRGSLPHSPLKRSYQAMKIADSWFVNVHLEHRRDYHPYRENQVKFLISNFKNEKHIIMGDFNSSPFDREQKAFHNLGYTNYFPSLTHPQPKPTRAIDGFWISPTLHARSVEAKSLFKNTVDGVHLSDHLGVFIKFTH